MAPRTQGGKVADALCRQFNHRTYIENPVPGAVVYGDKGTCKTSGCLAVLRIWTIDGLTAEFQDFSELMLRCRAAWKRDNSETVDRILLGDMMKPRILLLDDVGKRSTPEDQEYSGILLKGRHDRGLVTLLTANNDLDTTTEAGRKGMADFLGAVDDRGADRFAGNFIKITGPNVRRMAA